MPRFAVPGLLLAATMVAALPAAQPQPPAQPAFRAGVDLVAVDAIVVDADGTHVTDLAAAEFEIVESGRPRPIQQVTYVRSGAATRGAGATAPARDLASLGPPPGAIRADAIARTMAIVVDDLAMTFESTVYARRALHRFIDVQLGPSDLVAIVRTAGGAGVLQQFTTDRRLLHAAADGVQWTIGVQRHTGRPDTFAGPEPNPLDALDIELRTASSLGTLRAAVDGLRHLPGRKSVVFFADGFDVFAMRNEPRVRDALDRLVASANQAGVVLYAVDARGLEYAEPGAGLRELHLRQESLRFLADETGGFAVLNTNDLAAGLARALADQKGYYLIGFEPADGRGTRIDDVHVRVTRPGLRVRWRRGPFGPAQRAASIDGPVDALALAARSPFAAADITMRLTALSGHDRHTGGYIHALMLFDANDLSFTESAGAWRADVEVLLLTVGDNGRIAGDWRREVTLSLDADGLRRARERGVVYRVKTRLAGTGPYQVRAAVRDRASGRLGSATQFLVVPPAGRGHLAISSVLMRRVRDVPMDVEGEAGTVLGEPTIRVFAPGDEAIYAFEIYNGLGRDDVIESRMSVLHEGVVTHRGEWTVITAPREDREVRVVPVGGRLTMETGFASGAYVFQIEVARRRGERRDNVAAQWTSFEIR